MTICSSVKEMTQSRTVTAAVMTAVRMLDDEQERLWGTSEEIIVGPEETVTGSNVGGGVCSLITYTQNVIFCDYRVQCVIAMSLITKGCIKPDGLTQSRVDIKANPLAVNSL